MKYGSLTGDDWEKFFQRILQAGKDFDGRIIAYILEGKVEVTLVMGPTSDSLLGSDLIARHKYGHLEAVANKITSAKQDQDPVEVLRAVIDGHLVPQFTLIPPKKQVLPYE